MGSYKGAQSPHTRDDERESGVGRRRANPRPDCEQRSVEETPDQIVARLERHAESVRQAKTGRVRSNGAARLPTVGPGGLPGAGVV
jgi:hypothetical protein